MKKKWPKLLAFLLIFLSLFAKFWNFESWYGFDYDQEINALIAKRILYDGKHTLIGPETSTGGMFVGSYYNYIIAFFYWIGNYNPMSTIWLNILISLGTLVFLFKILSEYVSFKAGAIGIVIYGFSAMLSIYDRVSWNPTPIPLVSAITIYTFLKIYVEKKYNYFLVISFMTGFMFHLHFTAFLFVTFVLLATTPKIKYLFHNFYILCGSLILFTLNLLPLIIFDFRHEGQNIQHFLDFVLTNKQNNIALFAKLSRPWEVTITFFRAIFHNTPNKILDLMSFILLLSSLMIAIFRKDVLLRLLFLQIGVAIIFLSFYSGPIPSQYMLYVFPGYVIIVSKLFLFFKYLKTPFRSMIMIGLILYFFVVNSLLFPSNNNGLSLSSKLDTAKFVADKLNKDNLRLEFITDLGLNTGFNYLFWYVDKELSASLDTNRNINSIKIVIPSHIVESIEIKKQFGSLGIVYDEKI